MEFSIEYPFEELGIGIGNGWSCGAFNGTAIIDVEDDGTWSISDLWLECNKLVGGKWLKKMHSPNVTKQDESALYIMLCDALEKSRRAQIEEKVAEETPVTYSPVSTISAGRTL